MVERVRGFIGDLEPFDGRRVLVIGHSATRWALEVLVGGRSLEELVDAPFDWQPGWVYRTT